MNLSHLTRQEVEFCWTSIHDAVFEKIKTAVTTTPVLEYFDLSEEITMQCDASQIGLAAALMQNGQPIAYSNRALTETEKNYAQIESYFPLFSESRNSIATHMEGK